MRAAVVGALVEGAIGPLFPTVEGTVTVRAPVRGLSGTVAGSDLGQAATDFAAQLASLTAIVAIEIRRWSPTMGATTGGRPGRREAGRTGPDARRVARESRGSGHTGYTTAASPRWVERA